MGGVSFRAGVGAVLLDAEGRVLAFERSDVDEPAWQLPQGGLDAGEEPEDAVYREVEEETGLRRDELALVGRMDEPLAYELPPELRTKKTGRGQVGYWYFFRVLAEPRLPDGGEFRSWRAVDFGELVEATAPFRRAVYARLARHLEDDD